MSNIIPMVSSSPPPLDDGGGFNDWGDDDDDDFGNFTSAADGGDEFQAFTSAEGHWNSMPTDSSKSSSHFANFADFRNVSDTSSCDDNKNKLNNDNSVQKNTTIEITSNFNQEDSKGPGLDLDLQKTHHIGISDVTNNHNSHATNHEQDENLVGENIKQNETRLGKSCSENNFDSVSSISAGDSGLCSTDISPVPRSDEIYDPCDKSQGSDLDDFADFNSDSSVGKDVSIHPEESEKVSQNKDMCDTQERERELMVATPTEFESSVSSVGSNDRQRNQNNAEVLEDEKDSVTPLEALSDLSSSDREDSPTENIEIDVIDNISSQTSENCPGQSALSGTNQSLAVTHSMNEDDCDISENCNLEQRLKDNDCNNADLDSCIKKNKNSETENLDFQSISQMSCNESPTTSITVAHDSHSVDQSSVVSQISDSDDLSCKLEHDVSKINSTSEIEEENSNETGHKSENEDTSIRLCYDRSDGDDVAHPVAKSLDDCDSEKVQNVGSNSNEQICEAFSSDEQADNDDFTNFNTYNDTEIDNVQNETSGDDRNDTFQNIDGSDKEAEDKSSADFQETAFESYSHFEQHYSENAELELPSFKDFSTPTDNVSEDLDLSKDSEKVDNSGDDSKTEDDLDDEFDDFADFQTHPSEVNAKFVDDADSDGLGAPESENVATSNCDFAAFQSSGVSDGDGEWAVFPSDTAVSEKQDSVDDDFGDFDEFGDFSGGTTETLMEKEGPPKTASVAEKRTSASVMGECFPDFSMTGSLNEDIPSVLEVPTLPAQQDRKSSVLWKSLQANDVSTKLARLWSDSRGSNKLFQSLRIDTRNILLGHRKPSVPVYASNLTLLEPTKGPIPSDSKVENRLVDTTKTEEKMSSQDLPPVQFDWTNSGLTNPLEANNKTLELDFLVVKETESMTKNGVFDSELIHGRDPAKVGMQPLQNILANLKTSTTMKHTRQTENLSKEANKVLNCLPALSFMQAKVLMFPFRQDSDS